MRRGFDQPTSSSASRSSGTGTREQTQRTRQGRNDTLAQADSISARRRSSNPPNLNLPQRSDDFQPASSGRRSPAYLEGKNPYGQILDDVDHPYRRSKATGGAPSQVGATSEGRPRTTGFFEFKTRPEPNAEPEREVTAPDPSPPPLPPRTPANPVSVRAAKEFFESKASQNRPAPPLPPSAAAAAKIADVKTPSQVLRSATGPESVLEPSMPRLPPEAPGQLVSTQRTNLPARPNSDLLVPNIKVRKATARRDSPVYDDLSSSDLSEARSGRRRSTNIFETARQDAKPLGYERRAVDDSSKLAEASNAPSIAIEHTNRADDRHPSDETVRHCSTYLLSTAENDQDTADRDPPSSRTPTQRLKLGYTVRKSVEEDYGFIAKRTRRRKSRSAPLTEGGASTGRGVRSRSRKPSVTDLDQSPADDDIIRSGKNLKRMADSASHSFSHDGSGSLPSLSRQGTAASPVPKTDAHTRLVDPYVTVPDHVDWRGAYGRRRTKDFGFPGARIKPRGTYRTYRPLQDPGNWAKRACGHFSYELTNESHEDTSRRLCQQCKTKPPPKLPFAKQQRTRQHAATDSSSTSSNSSEKLDETCSRRSKRRKHHSECSPSNKCGDTFAKDLGYIIDSILEEHTNTLQGVINKIRHSQPSLAQLRRVSEDLVQRCQIGGVCTNPCHTPCRPSCTHHSACQPVCQQVCKPMQQVCD